MQGLGPVQKLIVPLGHSRHANNANFRRALRDREATLEFPAFNLGWEKADSILAASALDDPGEEWTVGEACLISAVANFIQPDM